jgi:hypothetical protein
MDCVDYTNLMSYSLKQNTEAKWQLGRLQLRLFRDETTKFPLLKARSSAGDQIRNHIVHRLL